MAEVAAGQPFYENTWLAAGGILLLVAILVAMLMFLIIVMSPMIRRIWRKRKFVLWIALGVIYLVAIVSFVIEANQSSPIIRQKVGPGAQSLMQQQLTQDEQALDKGVLTYSALPTLKTDLPTTLTAIVTDLGKHPFGLLPAQYYSEATGMVVYPRNIPTGGIVGLHLTCTTNVYCQALDSTRQAIVGKRISQSWNWNLTPLRPGPTSVVITATTYDETSNIVLHEEIISVRVKIEEGPWWAALDDLWHAMTNFATTTAGLITTIGGAVAVIAGGVRWIRRTRNKKAQPKPEGGMPSDAGAESSAREEAPPEATGSPET